MKRIYLFAIVIIITIASCKKNDTPSPVTPTPKTNFLKTAASFPMGAAVDPTQLQLNTLYKKLVDEEYNSLTAENAMKWGFIRPNETTFDYTEGDKVLNYAVSKGMRVHGHTLIWHSFFDGTWLKSFSGDSAAWENLMKTHIQNVVTHYKGKVKSWDVVNEAFQDDGTLRINDNNPGNGTEDGSVWARKLGTDYIARAFQYARAADPDALLFFNEYGQEYSTGKITAIVNMLNGFRVRGIPIDGIGLQMHLGVDASNAGIQNALVQLAATGLQIHISELDVNLSNFTRNTSLTYTAALQQKQSDKYKFVAATYKAVVPAAQRYGITLWGVSDKTSWLRTVIQPNEWPLPFDDLYQPKKCYDGFIEGLKQ